jgi:hypothetical protein
VNRLELTDDELEAVRELVRSEYLWWWKRARHARTAMDRERARDTLARMTPLCQKLQLDVPPGA